MAESMPKLKILCLHGWSQNATIIEKQSSAFRRTASDVAEFVYVTAPQAVHIPEYSTIEEREETANEQMSEETKAFEWWKPPAHVPPVNGFYVGFKETLEFIQDILSKEGPFDGILGFSQGAILTAILALLLENRPSFDLLRPEFDHPSLRFCIIVSGLVVNIPTMKELFNTKIKTPSLHICGEADTVVSAEKMRDMANWFDKPT
ncbi:hypothetical protein DFQ30_007762, partial [Apophysomyces sp. BC1015]